MFLERKKVLVFSAHAADFCSRHMKPQAGSGYFFRRRSGAECRFAFEGWCSPAHAAPRLRSHWGWASRPSRRAG